MQFKLCPDLQGSDVCLVVEQYRDGGYERRFHKHVPRDRLADTARLDLLRALVARFSVRTGPSAEQIVGSYLNADGEAIQADMRGRRADASAFTPTPALHGTAPDYVRLDEIEIVKANDAWLTDWDKHLTIRDMTTCPLGQ
jgi:hypothetical protein